MTFKTYINSEVNINIVKIEKSKFEDLLNEGETLLCIIDGELKQITVYEEEEYGFYFIEHETQKAVYDLDFVYKFV